MLFTFCVCHAFVHCCLSSPVEKGLTSLHPLLLVVIHFVAVSSINNTLKDEIVTLDI